MRWIITCDNYVRRCTELGMVEYVYTTILQIMFHKRTYLLESKLFATFCTTTIEQKRKKKTDGIPKSKDQRERFLHIPLYYWVRSSVRPNAYTHDDTTSLYQPTRKSPSVILLVLQPHHGSMARISFTVACATNNRISLPSMVSSYYSPGSTTLCADKEIWLLYSFQSRYHVALRGTRNKYFWTVVLTFNSTQGSYPSFCPPRCPTSFLPIDPSSRPTA